MQIWAYQCEIQVPIICCTTLNLLLPSDCPHLKRVTFFKIRLLPWDNLHSVTIQGRNVKTHGGSAKTFTVVHHSPTSPSSQSCFSHSLFTILTPRVTLNNIAACQFLSPNQPVRTFNLLQQITQNCIVYFQIKANCSLSLKKRSYVEFS